MGALVCPSWKTGTYLLSHFHIVRKSQTSNNLHCLTVKSYIINRFSRYKEGEIW